MLTEQEKNALIKRGKEEKIDNWCYHYEYLPFLAEDLSEKCGYCVHNKKLTNQN